MATCKECIHYEICEGWYTDICFGSILEINKICEQFADRSKFIELPCQVGDTVWFYSIPINTILPVKILELEMNNATILYKGVDTTYNEYIAFTEKDVNNSIFLTKEQAEQALKEREEE